MGEAAVDRRFDPPTTAIVSIKRILQPPPQKRSKMNTTRISSVSKMDGYETNDSAHCKYCIKSIIELRPFSLMIGILIFDNGNIHMRLSEDQTMRGLC